MAVITHIARCSLHDGPGIRTVIYLKGCNLHCPWCHNPENQAAGTEILFYPGRCLQCGRCLAICPSGHPLADGRIQYRREACNLCLRCADACPSEALSVCGREMSGQDVFGEISKDRDYYAASGGGVTFSGGECLLQPDFVAETAGLCRKAGIHTAVESAFCVRWEDIERIRAQIDLFIIDIKHHDSAVHRKLTGRSNALILANLRRLAALQADILIRIPLIPGVNDDDQNLIATAGLVNSLGDAVRGVELLKYNNLAAGKYAALDRPMIQYADAAQDDQTLLRKNELLRGCLRHSP